MRSGKIVDEFKREEISEEELIPSWWLPTPQRRQPIKRCEMLNKIVRSNEFIVFLTGFSLLAIGLVTSFSPYTIFDVSASPSIVYSSWPGFYIIHYGIDISFSHRRTHFVCNTMS